ncbi:catalase [Tistlia consotensis]|uniref:Catalase-related peroxidase n=1 Tax=Tistlia consotensis USBA 355 TaxID=560819 RepID=A0A1Y6BY72_9PROT|nr:catalase family peroxidase [Tistlia consotensis]SMF24199.1 catalase [Tistlia consotensis USBA 355]SNR60833.1 catalase [Tistlia consotensis]
MKPRSSTPSPAPSNPYRLSSLRRRGAPLALAGIALAVAAVVACFAYAGGWLSPDRLTQAKVMAAFDAANGVHPGFRRNHAKGLCIAGSFDSNGAGERLSSAAVFQPGRTPVVGRFALAGGQPFAGDATGTVRSMALSFRPAGGGEWRTGMNDIPVFPFRGAAAFTDQLVASRPDPATGKPDPARLQAFVASHPETAAALALIKARSVTSGFADDSYNSLDAFRFVDAQGRATPVRWSMVAAGPVVAATPAEASPDDPNFLFDAMIRRVAEGPVQWHLVVTLGQPGDPTDDATLPWPAGRERLDLGTLTIDRVEAEAAGNCRDINFDPLVLPPGIAPTDDPLLSARSAAYARSFTLRAGEPKQPSAVQLQASGKGS